METKQITAEMKAMLDKPLPPEAIKPHASKKFLSTINSIFVTERLNDVFGIGSWKVKTEFVTSSPTKNGTTMVVTKTIFEIPEYGIYFECYGGNDNADLGDAYKGSMTDALTKIGSYLGIGAHVWKNNPTPEQQQPQQQKTQQQQKPQQVKPNPQPQPVPAQRRQRVLEYLQKLDDITLSSFKQSFMFNSLSDISDDTINAIANYLNAQKK